MTIDKLIKGYGGIGKPDDKKKSVSVLSIITETFKEWAHFVEHYPYPQYDVPMPRKYLTALKNEATRLLVPYDNDLPTIIADESYFAPIKLLLKTDYHRFAGLYYTALLDMQERTLIIPEGITNRDYWKYNYWGYELKKGTVINRNPDEFVGECARGGVVINEEKSTCLGYKATGGLFVNYDSVLTYTQYARGGIFINHKTVGAFLYWKGKPLLLNYGNAKTLFLFHRKDVKEKKPQEPFLMYGRILLPEGKIKQDNSLNALWTELSHHSLQRDWSAVKGLAVRIKRHCTMHYKQNI